MTDPRVRHPHDEAAGAGITVEVAYATPARQAVVSLDVPAGTTLMQAVKRSGIVAQFPEINLEEATFGVFGKVEKDVDRALADGERVEIYRPLLIDPKAARANRAAKAKAAGKGGE